MSVRLSNALGKKIKKSTLSQKWENLLQVSGKLLKHKTEFNFFLAKTLMA